MWEKFKSVFLPENKSVLYLITNSVLQVGLSLEKGEVIIKQEYNWTFMWKIISIGLKISLPCNRTLVIQLLKFIAFLKLFQIFGTPPLQLYKLHGFYNNQIIIKHMELRCVFTVAKFFSLISLFWSQNAWFECKSSWGCLDCFTKEGPHHTSWSERLLYQYYIPYSLIKIEINVLPSSH